MRLTEMLRRGEGPFWKRMKHAAKAILSLHIPVNSLTRPFFALCYHFHVLIRESAIWVRRFFWNEPLFRSRCASIGSRFQMEELPYLTGLGQIRIGSGVRLSGKSSIAFGRRSNELPQLTIGDETFIGHGCAFHIGRSVRIGNHCLLAGGVQILDMDGHPVSAARRRAGEPTPQGAIAPVVIGDEVWIGNGAVILKGVTIGDRAIIAARSVVTKNVPPDTISAGNPAKVVKELPPDEETSAIAVSESR